MSLAKSMNKPPNPGKPAVKVSRGEFNHAPMTWAIYRAGRIASQPNVKIGLTKEMMIGAFDDPKSGIFGRTIQDWVTAIRDASGQQTVLNAFGPEADWPVGIARPNIDHHGKRWLSNVYKSEQSGEYSVFRPILAATVEWHGGEPFHLLVAEYNEKARAVYEKTGFEYTGAETGYEISGVWVPQIEMVHPGS